MAEFTNVSIDGTKTPLAFGAWFDFDLRDGRTIRHAKVVSRAANGDLEIAGTDDGPISRLRPAKIVAVRGSGVSISVSPALADALAETPEGPGYAKRVADRLRESDPAPLAEHPYIGADNGIGACVTCGEPFAGTRAHFVGGTATPVPATPTAFVDQVRDILSAPSSRGRYASGREATARVLAEPKPAIVRISTRDSRKPGETADAYLRRIERHPFYAAFVETDAGQALLREAADDSRAARTGQSHGAHRKTRGTDIEIPDGSKRCSGVPKRQIEPHIAPVAEFGAKRTAKDGLASTCKVCHRIFAEIGRAKRAAAKSAAAESAK